MLSIVLITSFFSPKPNPPYDGMLATNGSLYVGVAITGAGWRVVKWHAMKKRRKK